MSPSRRPYDLQVEADKTGRLPSFTTRTEFGHFSAQKTLRSLPLEKLHQFSCFTMSAMVEFLARNCAQRRSEATRSPRPVGH